MSDIFYKSNCMASAEDKPRQHAMDIMLSNPTEVRFLDKLQVLHLVPVSPTGLHELMLQADFPRPFVLKGDPNGTSGKSYWLRGEVIEWMLSRPKRVSKLDRPQEGK